MLLIQRPLRLALMIVFAACSAAAQSADLTALYDSALAAENRWLDLAGSLDVRLARMLPCDPRVAESIEQLRQASTERMSKLEQYLTAAMDATKSEGEAAAQINELLQARIAGTVTEANDTQRERQMITELVATLTASAARQPGLEQALTQLTELQASVERRGGFDQQHQDAENAALGALTLLVAALDQRREALEQELAAHQVERARWNSYYTTRMGRAQLECSITGQ